MEMEQLQQSLAQMAGQLVPPGTGQSSSSGHSNVYIRGLPLEVTESLLVSLFQQFGSVQSVRIFRSSQVQGRVIRLVQALREAMCCSPVMAKWKLRFRAQHQAGW